MTANAWMLRQDGFATPCKIHLYSMYDEDLSSEAEVSSFLISTNSKDQDLCKYVLDAWMALLIQDDITYNSTDDDICNLIYAKLKSLPYSIAYPLTDSEYVKIHKEANNYHNVDEYYEFVDSIQEPDRLNQIQTAIRLSLNQQFCRVRFGGKYDTEKGNSEIWFRISSTGYNWSNTIYEFVSRIYRQLGIQFITICRDYESDYGEIEGQGEYYYTAKDGSVYNHMPIDEFFAGEHESNPVFATSNIGSGVIHYVRACLHNGNTYREVSASFSDNLDILSEYYGIIHDIYASEIANHCVEGTTFEEASTKTKSKLARFSKRILSAYPEISSVSLRYEPRDNSKGKPTGFEMFVTLESDYEILDHMEISIASTNALANTLEGSLFRMFRQEYEDFKKFRNLNF